MEKTLIIKTGATGDVVRTTPLLRAIEGEIHWLTFKYNKVILPTDCDRLTMIFSVEEDLAEVKTQYYNKIISLEEDETICAAISKLRFDSLTGLYIKDDFIHYTADAAPLFNMSLVSTFGKVKADSLKFANTLSYQHLIFKILGKEFTGQQYWMRSQDAIIKKSGKKIGIEPRAGERWQGKIWSGYEQLGSLLKEKGYEVFFFTQKNTLEEYVADINSCDYIITGDTLAMHIAIASQIPAIAIFTCTSPNEIYSYNLLEKITTPKLRESFYQITPVKESIEAITVEEVFERCLQMIPVLNTV